MDRKKLILDLSETPDDPILLSRIWERYFTGVRRDAPAVSCFLSGREQQLVQQMLQMGKMGNPHFFGGFPEAERRVLIYVPDYLDQEEYLLGPEGPVAALRITFSSYDTLTHRDFLGGLLGQGIKREVLGDLLPAEHSCDVMVLREMVGYLSSQFHRVGRAHVSICEIALQKICVPKQKSRILHDTVASLRLDSILAAGFGQSRSRAAALIRSGMTEVNHRTVLKPDALLVEGDTLSVRSLGRLHVAEVNGQTKKGRTSLTLERFL